MHRLTTDAMGKRAHWAICDSLSEYATLPNNTDGQNSGWNGDSLPNAQRKAREGSLVNVAKSDAILAKFESEIIVSGRKATIDDVAGTIPNVPAYLAGSPLSMRYRRKTRDDSAPIGLVMDGTISGGLTHDQILKRGACMLALARVLSVRRPIELWFAVGLGHRDGAAFVLARLETAPLDLSRACYALTETSATRALGYGFLQAQDGMGSYGGWPFYGDAMKAADFQSILRPVLPHLTDILAIPGCVITDDMVNNPVAWIKRQLDTYGQSQDDDA